MKAPDKIYVEECSDGIYAHVKAHKGDQNIEFIRKSVLLEWAKQKQYESTTIVADNFWQEVIDKINTL